TRLQGDWSSDVCSSDLFTPSDSTDYTSTTASVQLQVNQATPITTWATPSAITFGTPLSASQLNATASVPGSFVYTPAAGSILPEIGRASCRERVWSRGV